MRGPFLPEIEDVIMSEIGTLRNGLVGARE
jgi:hypothetical protein